MAAEVIAPLQERGPLTAVDRCDRCNAQAYVRATIEGLDLLFCAHHGKEKLPLLLQQGFTVEDESEQLYN